MCRCEHNLFDMNVTLYMQGLRFKLTILCLNNIYYYSNIYLPNNILLISCQADESHLSTIATMLNNSFHL